MNKSKMKKSSPRELNSGGWVVNRTLENLMRTIDKYGDMLEEDTLARPDLGVDWWTAEYIAENIEKAIGELQKYVDELRQYANSGERKPIEEWQNAFDKSAKKSKSVKKDYDGEEDEVVEEYRGVEIWLFAEDGVYGIVDDEGEIIESYDDIESVRDYIDHIVPYDASAKKSYTPDYKDFRSMVGSIRNTRDHNKVFKE